MANRFNSIPEDVGYVKTAMPLPFNEIIQMGAMKQHAYDDALDTANKVEDEVLKVNAIDEHKPFKQDLINKYKNQVEGIADDIMKTGNTSKVRELKRIASQWQNDPMRVELETSYANKALAQKKQIELGDKYAPWGDSNTNFRGTDDKGNIQGYRFNGFHERQNWQEEARQQMAGLKPTGGMEKHFNIDPNTGNILSVKKGSESIAADWVRQMARLKSGDFVNTVPGGDFGRQIEYQRKRPLQQKDVEDVLFNAGANQIFNKPTYEEDFNYAPGYIANQKQANKTTSTASEGMNETGIDINGVVNDIKFNSDGSIKAPVTSQYTPIKSQDPSTGQWNNYGDYKNNGKPVFDEKKAQEQVQFINTLKQQYPDLKTLNPKEVVEAYQSAIKGLKNESIPLETISGVAAKNIGDAIARNMDQRNMYVWDGKGKTTDGTKETVLKELDITQEDLKKALENGVGGYTQSGPVSGSYYVEVNDSKGNSRRVMISPDEEMKKNFRTSQMVNMARKSFSPSEVQPLEDVPEYSIRIIPNISKDGRATWKYTEVIKDKDGNVVKEAPTTLDELQATERKHLLESGYLGSQVNILKDNTTE